MIRVSRIVRPSFLCVFLLLLAACASRPSSREHELHRAPTVDGEEAWLKAHLHDGRVYVLRPWDPVSGDLGGFVRGRGRLLDPDRRVIERGEFTIPVASVALFETNALELSGSVAALAIMSGITAGVTAACLTNPKACFGSCPTFYVDGDPSPRAEGFSASIAPSLEATDVDALYPARLRGNRLAIRMKNEALETHVVRHVRLRAAPRPPGGRVFQVEDGESFRSAGAVVPPSTCRAPEGDCLEALAAEDGIERLSRADPEDLATREEIEFTFDSAPGERLGFVVVSRQSLLSTFLLYQALAWMGEDAGRYLAAMERADEGVRERAGGIGRELGGIEVLVRRGDGRWERAGEVGETGPLARDGWLVPLPPLGPGPVAVRIRLTRGHWRLDRVGIVSIGEEIEPIDLDPHRVLQGDDPDPEALALLRDPDRQLVTFPGDEYEIVFHLPEPAGHYELFLESRGYYLEWMRSEWLEEGSALRAARLLLDPRGVLRALAPVYSRREAEMERVFWSSRYAPR